MSQSIGMWGILNLRPVPALNQNQHLRELQVIPMHGTKHRLLHGLWHIIFQKCGLLQMMFHGMIFPTGTLVFLMVNTQQQCICGLLHASCSQGVLATFFSDHVVRPSHCYFTIRVYLLDLFPILNL